MGGNLLIFMLWFVVILYLFVCPFTKVEESFNLQAIHDIIYHKSDLSQYDHHEFPGVVPRTFLGPLFVFIVSLPFQLVISFLHLPKLASQYLVRAVLGSLFVLSFRRFHDKVKAKFGSETSNAFIFITLTQFHLLFYASRTLPNTFALILVLLAYSYWLEQKYTQTMALFAFTIVVFRSEVSLLFAPLLLEALLKKQVSIGRVIITGILATALSLALTVSVDSVFWKRLCWPEGEVFWFNSYHNKSVQWGTSPYYHYFLNLIPKALMGGLPLTVIGLYYDARMRVICRPAVIFLILYSFLPHKELRFVFYVIPIFNLCAAIGLVRLFHGYKKGSRAVSLTFLVALALLLASIVASAGLLYVSSHNYPGGHAFKLLHNLEAKGDHYVHIANLAAITGVSRFGEHGHPWRYSKKENCTDFSSFTHLIAENEKPPDGFQTIANVAGYNGLDLRNFPFVIKLSPQLYIMKKINK